MSMSRKESTKHMIVTHFSDLCHQIGAAVRVRCTTSRRCRRAPVTARCPRPTKLRRTALIMAQGPHHATPAPLLYSAVHLSHRDKENRLYSSARGPPANAAHERHATRCTNYKDRETSPSTGGKPLRLCHGPPPRHETPDVETGTENTLYRNLVRNKVLGSRSTRRNGYPN